jgi:hypothetical protein
MSPELAEILGLQASLNPVEVSSKTADNIDGAIAEMARRVNAAYVLNADAYSDFASALDSLVRVRANVVVNPRAV